MRHLLQADSPQRAPVSRLRRRPALVVHAAGAICCVAYGALAVASRGREHVPLPLLLAVQAVAWTATLALFFRLVPAASQPARSAIRCEATRRVIAWAVVFRMIGLWAEPVLEDDYYRYLFDGYVFATTGSPYGERPIDWFAEDDVPEPVQEILDGINHPDLPTIYGPVCELVFLGAYGIAPGNLLALKAILFCADLAAILGMRRLASARGFLLFAWCPLLVQETSFNAHPDILGIAFLVFALLARKRSRFALVAIFTSFACGSRVFAALAAPFLLRGARLRYWISSAATFAALYVAFLIQGDSLGETALAAFLADWEFNSFGFGALRAITGREWAKAICGSLFVLFWIVFWFKTKRGTSFRDGVPRLEWIYGAFFFVSPVVNPWYVVWLLPFVARRPSAWGIAALFAVTLSYVHGSWLADPDLAPYEHPVWVRPLELATVLLVGIAGAIHERKTRSLPSEGDGH